MLLNDLYLRLFAGLWVLIIGGFMFAMVGGGSAAELGMAIGGAFLFSGKTQLLIGPGHNEESCYIKVFICCIPILQDSSYSTPR